MTKAVSTKHVVLYADDDADDLMLVRKAFENYASNVDVVTSVDGVQALSYLKNLNELDPAPCLIILDLNMPRMNGKEALIAIRSIERFDDIPIVLFTTSSFLLDKQMAQRYNASFLTKPLNAKDMQTIAAQFIAHCSEETKKSIVKRMSH
jgi:CheY-like chemotaxis protein